MEEIHEAAMAYYANMSKDEQKKFLDFFKKIDADGDGKVSIHEFLAFLIEEGHNPGLHENLFELLDKNKKGTLDFKESVTCFYVLTGNRLVTCAGCQSYLWGLHFLCIDCYKADREETYDLCCSCYRDKKFTHAHSSFLDNYALLRKGRRRDKWKQGTKKAFKYVGNFANVFI